MYTCLHLIGLSALIDTWENASRSCPSLVNRDMSQNQQIFSNRANQYKRKLMQIKERWGEAGDRAEA